MGPEHPDWVKLEREEERLDREEEETLSKLLRLRKQKRLIRTRGKDMLRRGLKTLDELDAAEEAERAAVEQPAETAPPVSDSNSSGDVPPLGLAPLGSPSPSFWEFLVSEADVYGAKTPVTLGN